MLFSESTFQRPTKWTCTQYLLARLSEAAHYFGNPVYVGYPVLYMRFGAKFWMSDLAHAGYDSVYFYYVIGLREVAFIKSIQEIIDFFGRYVNVICYIVLFYL